MFRTLPLLILSNLFITPLFTQNIEWEKNYGGSGSDRAFSIVQTADGGFAVAGDSWSSDGDVGGNQGSWDFWILKLDDNGNLEWEQNYGGSGWDHAHSIIQTADEGFAVAGWSDSSDGDVGGNQGDDDGWILKLGGNGNIEWEQNYGGSAGDQTSSILQTADEGFVVTGWSESSDGDLGGNKGNFDYWALKLDANGNIEWEQNYGGSDDERGKSVIQTVDGGFAVAGESKSSDGDVGVGQGRDDYWVLKLDANGNIEWEQNYGGSDRDEAFSIVQTAEGGFAVAGASKSSDGDVGESQGDFDYWVLKLDANGNIEWEQNYGGSDFDWGRSIQQTDDRDYIVAGRSESSDGDVSGNHGYLDYWIAKIHCPSTSSSITKKACDRYTVPSGDETYTSNGTYMDTIPNSLGCDSILTINLTIIDTTFSDSVAKIACDSFTVPSGDETYTTSGTYRDTIPGQWDCDSILTIDLTIKDTTFFDSITKTACEKFIVPSGDETYTSSGTYMDTIPNSVGCDSVLTIDLTINDRSTASISDTACNSYTVPSGDETYDSSGTYMDTISNSVGCDSILTIDLTINNSSTASISDTTCNSYTVPSGDETHTSSGIYKDTLTNSKGCDSILTIDLTINDSSTATISDTYCNRYTVPSGDETYDSSGTYMDTIPNAAGCDSILTIDLTINESSTVSITDTGCHSYTVPSGDETYTSSGTYIDTIPNSVGCDSILTIDLTVIDIDTAVTPVTPTTLEAVEPGASYQWLDCDNGYAPISGETNRKFIASYNGNYAVEVTRKGCTDTSGCHSITALGIVENTLGDRLRVYPNPADQRVSVDLGEARRKVSVQVTDPSGRTIHQGTKESARVMDIPLGDAAGIYSLRIRTDQGEAFVRVVKE